MKLLNVFAPILFLLALANCSIDVSIQDITANDFMGSSILASSRGVADGQVSATISILLKNADGSLIVGHIPSFVFIDNGGSAYTGNGITFSQCSASNDQGIANCVIKSVIVGSRRLQFNNIVVDLIGQVYFDPPNRNGKFFQVLNSAQVDKNAGGYIVTSQTGAFFGGLVHKAGDYTVFTNTSGSITPNN